MQVLHLIIYSQRQESNYEGSSLRFIMEQLSFFYFYERDTQFFQVTFNQKEKKKSELD